MSAAITPQLTDRRHWLEQILATLGLGFTLPTLESRAARRRGPERPTSLITLFLAGGPSQLETWDPHPGRGIGGPTRAIATRLPKLKIAADYPQTAEVINELSVVRSLVSREGDHERGVYLVKTGYRPDQTLTHPLPSCEDSLAELINTRATGNGLQRSNRNRRGPLEKKCNDPRDIGY